MSGAARPDGQQITAHVHTPTLPTKIHVPDGTRITQRPSIGWRQPPQRFDKIMIERKTIYNYVKKYILK